MVCISNVDNSVTHVLVNHFLKLVSVKLGFDGTIVVEGWSWGGRIDFVGRHLSDTFLVANGLELVAVDSTDSEHHLML
jgi:hypothetical protein